jgi:3-methyladenine DNA glycosylase AlkC
MAEPFKNLLNAPLVRRAGAALARSARPFDRRRFERLALRGLDALEMKARAMQIADALEATLPEDFATACAAIEAALGPPLPIDGLEAVGDAGPDEGLRGWIVWPLGEFVSRRGMDHPERALKALHALTQRLTGEFAIRRFIVAQPEATLATLKAWTRDASPHVRRLASEGSRPRLPWGLRLQALVTDPRPTLPILEALQDDPSAYVRRSVANHLNDIAKDHPALVVDWVRRHLPDASAERRALLRHASRTLIKQGHVDMLALWGAGAPFDGRARLTITPARVAIGDSVQLQLVLRSASGAAQTLLIDYSLCRVTRDGRTATKVFKGWRTTIAAGASLTLTTRHSFKPVTTRRTHPGTYRIEVSVNGVPAAAANVTLKE